MLSTNVRFVCIVDVIFHGPYPLFIANVNLQYYRWSVNSGSQMLGCCNRFNKPLPQAENLLSVWFMYHLYQYYVVNSFLVFLISDQELTSQKNCRQAIREGSHNGSHNGSRVVVF